MKHEDTERNPAMTPAFQLPLNYKHAYMRSRSLGTFPSWIARGTCRGHIPCKSRRRLVQLCHGMYLRRMDREMSYTGMCGFSSWYSSTSECFTCQQRFKGSAKLTNNNNKQTEEMISYDKKTCDWPSGRESKQMDEKNIPKRWRTTEKDNLNNSNQPPAWRRALEFKQANPEFCRPSTTNVRLGIWEEEFAFVEF